MIKNEVNIIQVSTEMPNPVIRLSGYEPTTDYWPKVITLVNAMIKESAANGRSAHAMQEAANATIEELIFDGDHTGVEWAEFTMALNHILWFWYEVSQEQSLEYLDPVLRVLDRLYYQWRDKALDTLKGDDISTFLKITD